MSEYDPDLLSFLKEIKKQNKPIALVTGVFDLLHPGHLLFLQKARERSHQLGGHLLIGLESDFRVKQLKGESRPINSQQVRKQQLQETNLAELVFILPTDFSQEQSRVNLLKLIKPQLMLVSTSTPNLEKKSEMLAKIGGKLEIICDHQQQYSTTDIINNGLL